MAKLSISVTPKAVGIKALTGKQIAAIRHKDKEQHGVPGSRMITEVLSQQHGVKTTTGQMRLPRPTIVPRTAIPTGRHEANVRNPNSHWKKMESS